MADRKRPFGLRIKTALRAGGRMASVPRGQGVCSLSSSIDGRHTLRALLTIGTTF